MIGKQTIGSKPVSLVSVKKILDKRKDIGELTYEQKLTHEYASDFGKGSQKKTEEAIQKLVEEGIDEKLAVKVADIRPQTKEEVRLIFEKAKTQPKEDLVKKIIKISSDL